MSKKSQVTRKDYKLFESNDIAKFGIMSAAGNVLSPIAYKALMYLIWVCNQTTPGSFERVKLSISELGESLGYRKDKSCNFSHNIKRVCAIIENVMSQPITIRNSSAGEIITFVWLQEVKINYRHNSIEVYFSHALADYFGAELSNNFTVIKLKYLNRLTTTASVVLYPFFCRYLKLGVFHYSVEELSKLLTGTPTHEYKRLKSNFIVPAIKAINSITDLQVEFEEIKSGRQVTTISFRVSMSPADDEIECFMQYNNLQYDEYAMVPYNDAWRKAFRYDMSMQQYVRLA